jgi:hypothetical protein
MTRTANELKAVVLQAYADTLLVNPFEAMDKLYQFVAIEIDETYDAKDPVAAAIETLNRVIEDLQEMTLAIENVETRLPLAEDALEAVEGF